VVDVYVECYDHTVDAEAQRRLAQTITDIMARRPHIDLALPYLSESYAAEIVAVQARRLPAPASAGTTLCLSAAPVRPRACPLSLNVKYFAFSLQMEAQLLREMLVAQMSEERMYRNSVAARNSATPSEERFGFPCELHQAVTHEYLLGGLPLVKVLPGAVPVGVLDLYESLSALVSLQDVVRSVVQVLAVLLCKVQTPPCPPAAFVSERSFDLSLSNTLHSLRRSSASCTTCSPRSGPPRSAPSCCSRPPSSGSSSSMRCLPHM